MTLRSVLPEEATTIRTEELASKWSEGRNAYPIYAALALQFQLSSLPYGQGQLPPVAQNIDGMANDLRWLDELDEKLHAVHLRQLLPDTLNTSEVSLRAFVQRQLCKTEKNDGDRDKLDLLLVRYFALCAPESLYHEEIHLSDVARVLQPVLLEEDSTPLEWCEPLEQLLASAAKCRSLRDLMERGLIETVRIIKETAGGAFYDPAALVAFCRFNFLLRRSFILLLHADKRAVLDQITQLENLGYKTLDGRRSGFSAAEPLKQIRQFAESWRQPIHKDYSELSVGRDFERLLALRADLEEALEPTVAAAQQEVDLHNLTEHRPGVLKGASTASTQASSEAPSVESHVVEAPNTAVAELAVAELPAAELRAPESAAVEPAATELPRAELSGAPELPAAPQPIAEPEGLAIANLLGETRAEIALQQDSPAEGELRAGLSPAVTRTESSAEFTLPAEAENQIEVPALPTEFPGETHDEVSNAPPSEQAEHLHVAESETHAEGGPREFELRSPAPVDESGSLSMPVGIGDQEFSTADLPVPSLGLQSEPVAEVIPILSGMPNEGLFASVHETANESGQTDVDAISRESVSAEARSETTAPATASSEPQAAREAPATPEAGAAPETNAAAAELPAAQTEMEDCLERIWEQLIDAPPSRGRSMSTVILKNSKVLLSSWEVTAFLSEGGQDSEDLRRAVVARSLLVMAIDERKHSGDAASLETALAGARKEVSYFQVRVEQSKRDKNVEAAVNLSISTKRLLSSLEVAEALRP